MKTFNCWLLIYALLIGVGCENKSTQATPATKEEVVQEKRASPKSRESRQAEIRKISEDLNKASAAEDEAVERERLAVELTATKRVALEERTYELMVEALSIEVATRFMSLGSSGITYKDLKDAVLRNPKITPKLEAYRGKLAGMDDLELAEEHTTQLIRNIEAKEIEKDPQRWGETIRIAGKPLRR